MVRYGKKTAKLIISLIVIVGLLVPLNLSPGLGGYALSNANAQTSGNAIAADGTASASQAAPSDAAAVTSATDIWPMFQHDPQHTGRSPYVGPSGPVMQKWEYELDAAVGFSPAVGQDGAVYSGLDAEGRIYVGNKVYALKPDGTKKWEFPTGDDVPCTPAVAPDGTVYFASRDNKVYALKPDGTKKWEFVTGDDVNSSPVLGQDGTIYIGSDDKKLYALKPDGTKKWEFVTGDKVPSSPALGADGTIYFGIKETGIFAWTWYTLMALTPDGQNKWEVDLWGNPEASPLVGGDGTIYVGTSLQLMAFSPDGQMRWNYSPPTLHPESENKHAVHSSLALGADGTLYFGSSYDYEEEVNCNPLGLGCDTVVKTDYALRAVWQAVTVSSITPNQGLKDTSVDVNLAGALFETGATVKLKSWIVYGLWDWELKEIVATNVRVLSSTQIACTFNLADADRGPWDVEVTNSDGRRGTLGGFWVGTPPTVTSITPNWGTTEVEYYSATFHVGGRELDYVDEVWLKKSGQPDIAGWGVYPESDTLVECRFDLSGAAAGVWDVVTKSGGFLATLPGGFRAYNPAPTVSSITPNQGSSGGTVSITNLAGTGFQSGVGVKLTKSGQKDIDATNEAVVSATKITCRFDLAGVATGAWDVVVTNPHSLPATLAGGFTVRSSAPSVTGITPNWGANTGSVYITNLAGAGFVSGATVKLKKTGQTDIAAANVIVVSSSGITCDFNLTGKAAGLWDVVVTNLDGQWATLGAAFAVKGPPPTVTGITPSSGANTDTVDITNLAGAGFLSGASVKLTRSGQPDIVAIKVNVVASTKITCSFDLTGKATGAWDVVVTNPDSLPGTLQGGFTVITGPPTVTGITPSSGTNSGSVSITDLAGTGFVSGASVKLRKSGQTDIAATSVTVVSAAQITCAFDLTSKATGNWDVVVTNSDGQSGTLAGGFLVRNPSPTVTSITPNSATNSGSVNISDLAGTGFMSGASVKLKKTGQTDIAATSVTVVSATKITCTFDLTGKATGAWDVEVTNPDSLPGTLAGGFTVKNPQPTVSGITPNWGTNNGTVSITDLAGTGFMSGASVKLRKSGQTDIAATSVTVVSATKITCSLFLLGKAVGNWDVVVTNSDGQSGTLAGGFTVKNPPPTVTSITPNSATNSGSVSITDLAGTGFMSGATVKLRKSGQTDIAATSVTMVSATKITCTFDLTSKATGNWDVVVVNADGQSGTLTGGFAVTVAAPTVASITPNYGANTGSVNITNLAGTGFLSGATVKLRKTGQTDIAGISVTVVSATKITCTFDLTGKAGGIWDVVVTNPDSAPGTLNDGFIVTGTLTTATIGTSGSISTFLPMGTQSHDLRAQVIYLASEIGTAGLITSLALDVETVPGQTMNNWTIRIKTTSLSAYSASPAFEGSDWTTVYQGNELAGTTTGWRTFNFTTAFQYDGVSNLLVDFSFNNSSTSTDGRCRRSIPGGNRTIYYDSASMNGDPLTWGGTPWSASNPQPAGPFNSVPNLRLTVFPLAKYTLSTSVSPSGSGSVSPSSGTFSTGTGVILNASPAATVWVFDHWEGNASGTNPSVTITMDSNKSVTAFFVGKRCTLTIAVNPSGSGSVEVSPAPGADGKYGYGAPVQLTATPSTGWEFDSWVGLWETTSTAITNMDDDKSVTACFVKKRYNLTIATDPSSGGTVEVNAAAGDDGKYEHGTTVQLTAHPHPRETGFMGIWVSGWLLDHWVGDLSGNSNPLSILMDNNKSVTAFFVQLGTIVDSPVKTPRRGAASFA